MKFTLSFKTPDVLDQILDDIDDEDVRIAVKKVAKKFIEYGET